MDGQRFVLDEGDFFVVSAAFREELDREVAGLDRQAVELPASEGGMGEAAYNLMATERLDGALCLDRQLVRVSSRTTPIELCDILTSERKLVHVKRHLGSADLSHLFLQGENSAVLLQESQEFRQAAQEVLNRVAARNCGEEVFPLLGVRPGDYEVVYGIVARWRERSLVEALPFFSKISLRHVALALRSRGFGVACVRVADGT
jgi:uncharacterized protein (TIGR04141 family)